jgi:steroid 5-alpha reductase family enzyme
MRSLTGVVTVIAVTALTCMLGWLVDDSDKLLFGLPLLVTLALFAYAIQWLAFVPAYWRQTEHFYDLTGSLTYAAVVLLGLWAGEAHDRALLLALLVLAWCARLGSFLFRRVRRDGKDGRFDDIKPDWSRFLLAWTMQGLWVFMTLLAALIAMTDSAPAAIDAWAIVGAGIWLGGFAIEVAADAQKSSFKADPANQGRFIDSGLWAWSRHPNYFGEILLWVGICIIASPSFVAWQWLGLLSPLFVAWLITRVSGVPLLEERSDEKWGGQADYEQYKASTPVLFLRPPR